MLTRRKPPIGSAGFWRDQGVMRARNVDVTREFGRNSGPDRHHEPLRRSGRLEELRPELEVELGVDLAKQYPPEASLCDTVLSNVGCEKWRKREVGM